MKQFVETLYPGYQQTFAVEEILFEQQTDHQHLVIFRHKFFGHVLALDGIVQTTERDEFIYHETLAHTPILAHGNARRVLIIGGGDGAMLREVTQHAAVEAVTQVEIDDAVIAMAKQFLPHHSAGAFDDPRVEIVIADGLRFVQETEQRYDVIISDSTDPEGPGERLFTADFYAACRRCLRAGGIFVAQNGVAFLQPDEVRNSARRTAEVFADSTFFCAAVPTYVGGIMTFAWGSDDPALRAADLETLTARYHAAAIRTRYYNPAVHLGSFALPQYVLDLITADVGSADA